MTYMSNVLEPQPTHLDNLIRADKRLSFYDLTLQGLVQRLSMPASCSECFVTLALLQRTYLDFSAAYNWVTDFCS